MNASLRLGLENTYAHALKGLYLPWRPAGFPEPELVQLNGALAEELGLDVATLQDRGAELLSGTLVPTDSEPLAQAYAGHQFGGFSPQLGDGRAVLLGEIVDPRGRRRDLHLKGSGPTPFSRGGDGKATLGPILREYLVSEAMHHLGIPTSRALAVLTTGETVVREEPLPGALLARVAASHLRVGTFEFFAARRDAEALRRLVEYSLWRHYPEAALSDEPAAALLDSVAESQARLVAGWMAVGFVHGVMNTDNTTISGETLDYGPCAFMDAYHPGTVFSSIDHQGRYAYGNQPAIGHWNLARLGDALRLVLHEDPNEAVARAQVALDRYVEVYQTALMDRMRAKLGLVGLGESDAELVSDWLGWLRDTRRDYTGSFRLLSRSLVEGTPAFDDPAFAAWVGRWEARLGTEDRSAVADRMDAVNPLYIPRNHLVQEALDSAVAGDPGPFRTLLGVLSRPFEGQPGREAYAEAAPAEFGRYTTFCGT